MCSIFSMLNFAVARTHERKIIQYVSIFVILCVFIYLSLSGTIRIERKKKKCFVLCYEFCRWFFFLFLYYFQSPSIASSATFHRVSLFVAVSISLSVCKNVCILGKKKTKMCEAHSHRPSPTRIHMEKYCTQRTHT